MKLQGLCENKIKHTTMFSSCIKSKTICRCLKSTHLLYFVSRGGPLTSCQHAPIAGLLELNTMLTS